MEMSGTTVIKRPVEEVFDYVMDVSNDVNWRTGIDETAWQDVKSSDPGTVGYTIAGGTKAVWRIIEFTPNESITWEFLSGPFDGRGGYRVLPVEGGTQFTLYADIVPTNWFKYLGPIFDWVGRRQNQADVEKLRDILESQAE
jgi:uncharacterized membrane protein